MVKDPLDIIKGFQNQKILVIGDLILDRYFFGQVNRISSEAPVPVLDIQEIKHVLGGAANTANNLKTLGAQVILIGLVGPDEGGGIFKTLLAKEGIDSQGIFVDEGRKTTVKMRAMAKNQQLLCIGYEDRNPIEPKIEGKLLDFLNGKIGEVKAVLVSDYERGLVTRNLAQNIVKLTDEKHILSFADSKGNDYLKYRNYNIVTMNEKELARALNLQIHNEDELRQGGQTLLSNLSSDRVLIKRGAKGMTLFLKSGESFHYPAVNKNAVDVSGAGDTALATFTLALMGGADSQEAVVLTSHACGVKVGKIGTAVVLPEELNENWKNYGQN